MVLLWFILLQKSFKSIQISDKLVEAFPQTFGYSTRISLTKDTTKYIHEMKRIINSVGEYGLHRTASVAQNLNSLPLYRLMLTLNEDTFQPLYRSRYTSFFAYTCILFPFSCLFLCLLLYFLLTNNSIQSHFF